jgi:murein DD-endopeptidase MepM/ murein hydrolase activator NlpD
MIIMIQFLLMVLALPSTVFAIEGYSPAKIEINYIKGRGAVIQSTACFPVTVTVNNKDFSVPSNAEVPIGSEMWGHWHWRVGVIGSMTEKTVTAPLKNKIKPEHGPGESPAHKDDFLYGYDFNTPEGTPVHAMDYGKVIMTVQHYTVAHQDPTRGHEANGVEILHADGSISRYVHLKANSIKVTNCQDVKRGDVIGESGNTGWSSGPHLHVDYLRPIGGNKIQTIPLKFLEF